MVTVKMYGKNLMDWCDTTKFGLAEPIHNHKWIDVKMYKLLGPFP